MVSQGVDFVPQPEPDAIDVHAVARKASVSPATIWRLRAAGKMPAPIRIGHSIRWRRADIEAWIAAGCNGDCSQPDSSLAPVNRRKRTNGVNGPIETRLVNCPT